MTLREAALDIARTYVGVHEEAPNTGPEVNLFLASVGLNPGYPWCAAFAWHCVMKAAAKLGLENPLPRTGSVLRMWRQAQPYMRDSNPQVGFWYFIQHSETTGHVGVVDAIDDFGVISGISGNTNEKGSREGTHVLRKVGQPEVVHGGTLLGYLNVDLGAQPALVA